MYIVDLINDGIKTNIHAEKQKLKSGNVVQGINTIDSFSFTMLLSNRGFNRIHDFKTLVTVYNTNREKFEFQGRVLHSNDDMSSEGLITKEVTCESFFGFFCDSVQTYVEEKNWTVIELFSHIIGVHNSQVEEYKRFEIGEITVTDPNDNVYIGIQRDNTWKTIEEKLINKLGGEIRFRVVDDVIYIDYLKEIGEHKTTPIKLSRNMKSISREIDPSACVTRLIPLGCKLKNAEGNETEERLDITSVNNGLNYIDDEAGIEKYGIHVGYVEFDDVTEAANLLTKGRAWLEENNKIQIKYSISALDLSLLGLDIDSFDAHNYHPVINPLLGIDDTARIIKKNINVCEDYSSSIEVGDNFKTLSDIQREQANEVKNLSNSVNKIAGDYASNKSLEDNKNELNKLVEESESAILKEVEEKYATKEELEELETTLTEFSQAVTEDLDYLNEKIDSAVIGQKVLWSGGSTMTASDNISLSESISQQPNGIELVFSLYSGGNVDGGFSIHRVSKEFISMHSGAGSAFSMISGGDFANIATKKLYIFDDHIVGDASNAAMGTANGITYANNAYVLRYVIGV